LASAGESGWLESNADFEERHNDGIATVLKRDIDEVIALIRAAPDAASARAALMARDWPADDVRPLLALIDDERNQVTDAGMVRFTEGLGSQYGVRAICGKGGFPDSAIEPMQRLGMVYFAIVGGAAALETTQIEEIEEVLWEELMPECLWKFRVRDFGPLIVGIDAHGNSLYHDVQAAA